MAAWQALLLLFIRRLICHLGSCKGSFRLTRPGHRVGLRGRQGWDPSSLGTCWISACLLIEERRLISSGGPSLTMRRIERLSQSLAAPALADASVDTIHPSIHPFIQSFIHSFIRLFLLLAASSHAQSTCFLQSQSYQCLLGQPSSGVYPRYTPSSCSDQEALSMHTCLCPHPCSKPDLPLLKPIQASRCLCRRLRIVTLA